MTADSEREDRGLSRRVRDELERMRDAEARVEEALESVREARRRVEVVARELRLEEERAVVRAVPAPAAAQLPDDVLAVETRIPGRRVDPAPSAATSTTTAGRSPWWDRVGYGLLAALVVATIGWVAIRGLRVDSATPAVTRLERLPDTTPAPAPTPPEQSALSAPGAGGSALGDPLATLPAEPAARQALYDSLFAARSSLFDPLLTQLEDATDDRAILRALDAWREGPVDAQDADLIHSALLQMVLRAEFDQRIQIDGQVLRNPCRGRSCSTLLVAWEQQGDAYGLPTMPESVRTDPRALRLAEAALVLSTLGSASAPASPPGSPPTR